jgi:hypothetical protein
VNSSNLTPQQIERLTRSVRRADAFLSKLTGRMCQRHFPHDDPLRLAAEKAHAMTVVLADVLRDLASTEGSGRYPLSR